jgi:hypothetical protein
MVANLCLQQFSCTGSGPMGPVGGTIVGLQREKSEQGP